VKTYYQSVMPWLWHGMWLRWAPLAQVKEIQSEYASRHFPIEPDADPRKRTGLFEVLTCDLCR